MAEIPQYDSIAEKFEAITKGKRPMQGTIWVTNERMNALNPGNPVLMEVLEKLFRKENSQLVKQGYTQYKHEKPAPPPVEAKRPAAIKNTESKITE